MTLTHIVELLRQVKDRSADDVSKISDGLALAKQEAIGDEDEAAAKHIWCLEQILLAQQQYIASFELLRQADYYEAWCKLERIELTLRFLAPHFGDSKREFWLDFIRVHSRQWQELFPYRIFMSPEIIEHEKICSICRKVLSIRNPCGHRVGEIYGGQMCHRIVTRPEFIGTAFVESPVQKYSVPFLVDPKTGGVEDQYNYKLVQYAALRLTSAFDGWSFERIQRRHPHSRFASVGRNDPCPCGSKDKYKRCCLPESGVLGEHVQFTFCVPPPPELITIEYEHPRPR